VPEAVVFILRAVVLVLLWGFVAAAIVAVRHDLLGVKPAKATATATAASAAPAPARKGRSRREPVTPRQLVVVAGPQSGTTVALGRLPVTIGRADDCGLPLSDDYASNHHARLIPNGDGWQVEDTGSTNGTFVADNRITSPVTVTVGTPIRIGQTVMELRS
jgi:pSer/pThr/pTyr-binding forkhead associated (FHA) protein